MKHPKYVEHELGSRGDQVGFGTIQVLFLIPNLIIKGIVLRRFV